jgi:spore germination protein KC
MRGGGGQGAAPRSFILVSDAPVLADALSTARTRWNKPLDFGHLGVMIVGEEAAREGIKEYLRCGGCHPEISTGILVAVARGKAEGFLRYEPPTQELVSDYYMFLLKTAASANLVPAEARLAMAVARGESAGVFLLPRLTRGRGLPRAEGAAVFEGYRLRGWLSARESQGVALLTHRKGRLLFSFPCPQGQEQQPVNFLVKRRKLKREVKFERGIPSFRMRVELEGIAIDAGCQLPSPIAPPDYQGKIERAAARKARSLALLALNRSREMGVDFLGLGEEIRKKHPSRWRELKGRWKEVFPRAPVSIEVKVRLHRSGILR